jgi:hypothetical protein
MEEDQKYPLQVDSNVQEGDRVGAGQKNEVTGKRHGISRVIFKKSKELFVLSEGNRFEGKWDGWGRKFESNGEYFEGIFKDNL